MVWKNPAIFIVMGIASVAFTGCGQGGGKSDSPSIDAHQDAIGEPTVRTGRFLDSPVSGLTYSTNTRKGVTDVDGSFHYMDGETVTFYLGNPELDGNKAWKLGETIASSVVTPLDLADSEQIGGYVANTVRLLQTLDTDVDPSNGIEIQLDVHQMPDGNLPLDLSSSESLFESDPVLGEFVSRASGREELVDTTEAVDHFQSTLNELLGNPAGSWVLVDATFLGEHIPDVRASITFSDDNHYAAELQWGNSLGSATAEYRLDGLSLNSQLLSTNILDGDESEQLNVADHNGLTLSMGDLRALAFGLNARFRLLPNTLSLESSDRSIVLTFVRGSAIDNEPIAYVSTSPDSIVLTSIGEEVQLEAGAHSVSSLEIPEVRLGWQTSDPSIVTVSDSGRVTAVASGTATVMVSAAGIEAAIQVDVEIAETVDIDTEVNTDTITDVQTDQQDNPDPSSENDQNTQENEEITINENNDTEQDGPNDPQCKDVNELIQNNEERVVQVSQSDDQEQVDQQNTQTITQNNGSGKGDCTKKPEINTLIPGQ